MGFVSDLLSWKKPKSKPGDGVCPFCLRELRKEDLIAGGADDNDRVCCPECNKELTITNVDGKSVLDEAVFHYDDTVTIGMLAPSGAGKTTLKDAVLNGFGAIQHEFPYQIGSRYGAGGEKGIEIRYAGARSVQGRIGVRNTDKNETEAAFLNIEHLGRNGKVKSAHSFCIVDPAGETFSSHYIQGVDVLGLTKQQRRVISLLSRSSNFILLADGEKLRAEQTSDEEKNASGVGGGNPDDDDRKINYDSLPLLRQLHKAAEQFYKDFSVINDLHPHEVAKVNLAVVVSKMDKYAEGRGGKFAAYDAFRESKNRKGYFDVGDADAVDREVRDILENHEVHAGKTTDRDSGKEFVKYVDSHFENVRYFAESGRIESGEGQGSSGNNVRTIDPFMYFFSLADIVKHKIAR